MNREEKLFYGRKPQGKNTFVLKFIISMVMFGFIANLFSCKSEQSDRLLQGEKTAAEILGNPNYLAIAYGGYRTNTRRAQPTVAQIKEDLKILSAVGIKILRTYNVHMPHAVNVLKAISELKEEDADFEMYVMLGAWIDCKNAWTGFEPIHEEESERNATEIGRAVQLANEYADIVKVVAVGNEAMVKWATAYYVLPKVILKWVNHIQTLKSKGKFPKDTWVTSSDNFASWGGGEDVYKVEDLTKLYHAVDYVSIHTYPMHDTHYNPVFWGNMPNEMNLTAQERIDWAMRRSLEYAKSQYKAVESYMHAIGVNKPIHIGETGWATFSKGLYGANGSKACDEYKQAKYYEFMRDWTNKEGISCFYFEAFDEIWKDAENPRGSENHFGLFTVEGKAKFALWKEVDKGVFSGLSRDGQVIDKTYNGQLDSLLLEVMMPPQKDSLTPKLSTP